MLDQYRKRNRLALSEYRGVKTYSLTLCPQARKRRFDDEDVIEYCLVALRTEASRFEALVYAYCFMPDHLHLLVGSEEHDVDLFRFVKAFKQKTAWWFKHDSGSLKASPTASSSSPSLWQKSYYDHIVRSDVDLRAAAEYVLGNPVRAGFTEALGQYRYAGSFVWDDL
jgi:putative transposase